MTLTIKPITPATRSMLDSIDPLLLAAGARFGAGALTEIHCENMLVAVADHLGVAIWQRDDLATLERTLVFQLLRAATVIKHAVVDAGLSPAERPCRTYTPLPVTDEHVPELLVEPIKVYGNPVGEPACPRDMTAPAYGPDPSRYASDEVPF